jgi:hypothetical protein
MKITKRQLRRIIKEEKARLLNEAHPTSGSGSPAWKAFEDAIWDAAGEFIDAGMESDVVATAMAETVTEIIKQMDEEQADFEGGFKS